MPGKYLWGAVQGSVQQAHIGWSAAHLPLLPSCPQHDLLDLGAGRDPRFRFVHVYIELYSRRIFLRALTSKEAIGVAREVSNGAAVGVGVGRGTGVLASNT